MYVAAVQHDQLHINTMQPAVLNS